MLEYTAYKCLCDDQLYFVKPLNDLSANLGIVKQSQSHLKLKSLSTYTFTHKSLAEYLTARYIVKQAGATCSLKSLLTKIPEVQDPEQRQASLILIFVCGLLTKKYQLVSLYKTFLPKVTSQQDSHRQHLALECAAEIKITKLPTRVIKKRVCKEVWCEKICHQYCALGIKRLHR